MLPSSSSSTLLIAALSFSTTSVLVLAGMKKPTHDEA